MDPRTFTRNEIPEGMRAIHDTTFANLEEARQALGGLAPSSEAIAGTSPWPRQPSTLLTTPRLVAAWSTCAIARAQAGTQVQAPPTVTPAASIDPASVRDFNDLVGRGIEAMTRFQEEHPADYQRLKDRQQQALRSPMRATFTTG